VIVAQNQRDQAKVSRISGLSAAYVPRVGEPVGGFVRELAMIEETGKAKAKAVQAVAEASGKGIDATRELGGFLNRIMGRGLEELGGGFGDWAAVWRYGNALRLRDKVEAMHLERGITDASAVPIPPRIAVPLLDHASQEDVEELTDMWAALIANATDADPGRHVDVSRLLVTILSGMEPLDARVIKHLFRPGTEFFGSNIHVIGHELGIGINVLVLSLENLHRLGLIVHRVPYFEPVFDQLPLKNLLRKKAPGTLPVTHADAELVLSHLGQALVRACDPTATRQGTAAPVSPSPPSPPV
jgi:hypothetical protein